MLLTKLKLTMCAAALMVLAGVGATGLTYRATAQEPKRPGSGAFFATTEERRPQVDELEALRLEMEALRKSLQATRERVKTLEGEVSTLKARSGGPAGGMMGGGMGMGMGGGMGTGLGGGMGLGGSMMKGPNQPGKGTSGMMRGGAGIRPKVKTDPVSDAEAALKKLRENPGDKQATEALERALQRLKEQEKQNAPEGAPNR